MGGALAHHLNAGFVMARKKGKLPYRTVSYEYKLEYGSATMEMHEDAIEPGTRILVHDDLLATGGTAQASCALIEQLGAVILFYGLPPRPSEVERILAPLQFHHAGRDARVGSEIPTLRTSLEQRKVPGEVLVYDTALSGFLDAGDAAYDAASADLAWTRTLTFLDATRVG